MNLLWFVTVQVVAGTVVSVVVSVVVVFALSGEAELLPATLLQLVAELTGHSSGQHATGGGELAGLLATGWLRQATEMLFLTLTLGIASLVWMASATTGQGRPCRRLVGPLFWIPGPLLLSWILLLPDPPWLLVVVALLWTACSGALLPETGHALVGQASADRSGPAFQLLQSTRRNAGLAFPWPGTLSGWVLAATAYRVFPELLSRLPSLVGFALVLEVVRNQPGLGTLAVQSLVSGDRVLLAACVIAIQLLVRGAALPLQVLLFVLYPRRRWSLT